jgi:hypothetical protein
MTMTPDDGTFVVAVHISSTVGWVGAVGRVGLESNE